MKQLIVDYGLMYNRIALLENKVMTELYIEDLFDRSYVGNIYLGRVVNVVKSMSAAFVDIGLEKNAYLPWREDIVNGSEIFVQVTRDPVGSKGATLTTDISISGQFVVLLPMSEEVMISRRISDQSLRTKLKDLVASHLSTGAVIRTEAAEIEEERLVSELKRLKRIWEEMSRQKNRILSNRLVYVDYAFESLIQKEYLPHVDEMYVNDQKAMELFQTEKVTFYKEPYPIFEHFRVEEQILASLNREVKLHQGSVITIDETEALTAIDVNSGSFVGSNNKEETFLQVNLAAAKEIARQIRLRNISGIIIIDFINMKKMSNYKLLETALQNIFKKDKCQPKIHGITSLGLMEITRKKNRKSLKTQLVRTCELCNGAGYNVNDVIYYKKFIEKMKILKSHTQKTSFEVLVSENMLELLSEIVQGEQSYLEFVEEQLKLEIILVFDETLEGYQFKSSGK